MNKTKVTANRVRSDVEKHFRTNIFTDAKRPQKFNLKSIYSICECTGKNTMNVTMELSIECSLLSSSSDKRNRSNSTQSTPPIRCFSLPKWYMERRCFRCYDDFTLFCQHNCKNKNFYTVSDWNRINVVNFHYKIQVESENIEKIYVLCTVSAQSFQTSLSKHLCLFGLFMLATEMFSQLNDFHRVHVYR